MRALGVPAIAVIVTALFAGGVVISHEAARTGEASAASVAPSPYELVSMDAPYGKGTATLRWRPVDGVSGYDIKIDEKTVSSAGVGQTFATFAVKGGHHKFAAWTKYPAPPPPTTTAPTTSTGGTTTTPPVTTTPTTTSTPTTTAGPPPAGQVTLRTTGSDSGCARNGPACATFNRAFAVALGGDTVVVHGGSYPADAPPPAANRNQLDDAKTTPATFVCAGDGNVTFQAPLFVFWAGSAGATFQGGCFHFHAVMVGLGGYPTLTHDIRLDGVHMDAPEIIGAKNVAIVNSEIGPFVACGAADAPSTAACPTGSYWAQFPHGTDAVQQQPFIHSGAAGKAINVTLDHDTIHGITSLWSGTHTGGLLIWDTDNLHITNTTFSGNAVYDIEQNAGSTDNGLVLQGDTLGFPVFTPDGGSGNNGHQEVECCGSGDQSVNWLIDHNTFVNGLRIAGTGSFSNVTVSNNQLGSSPTCGPFPGVTFVGNTRCG